MRVALPEGPVIERGRTRAAARIVNELQDSTAVSDARDRVAATSGRVIALEDAHVAHERAAARVAEHRHVAAKLAAEADELAGDLAAEGHAMASVLRRLGFLEGWTPTAAGLPLRRLFHPAGLLVAVALHDGLFRGTSAHEMAVLAACCLGRHDRSGTPAPVPAGARRYAALVHASERLARLEHEEGVHLSPLPDPALAAPVAVWAGGGDLAEALDVAPSLRPGDLVRDLRQVAELLGQMAEGTAPEAPVAAEAAGAILRGAVVAGDG